MSNSLQQQCIPRVFVYRDDHQVLVQPCSTTHVLRIHKRPGHTEHDRYLCSHEFMAVQNLCMKSVIRLTASMTSAYDDLLLGVLQKCGENTHMSRFKESGFKTKRA